MTKTYNIYCDESCHLEKDQIPVMVLGGGVVPFESVCGSVEEASGR